MSTLPKVSVIVPAYNVRSYIEAALNSLKAQSFQNFEVLIVDDGSTDDTAKLVKAFCQSDSRFRLLQKQNGGLSSARNHGINQSCADYVALLDSDDAYAPDKLANHVSILDHSPQVGVVYSASQIMRDDGHLLLMYLSGKPIYAAPLLALLCKNFIGHGSNAVLRRCLFDEVGYFDETLRSSEDIDFWLRVAATQNWQFHRESKALCYYRVRPSGLSFNVAQMQQCSEQVIKAAHQRSPEIVEPMLPTAYAYMYRYLARLSLTAGNTEQARQFIQQAWTADRSIFVRDPRSLLTLLAVQFAPISKHLIGRSLGSTKSVQGKNL